LPRQRSCCSGCRTWKRKWRRPPQSSRRLSFQGISCWPAETEAALADASHLTTEFVARYDRDRRAYPAISLASHGGDLTAIGNDYSFADLFARQVQAYGSPDDVLVVFTTSGNSENIFRALLAAKALKMKTIAFLGRDGGECAGLADVELLVGGKLTARIQEGHKFLLHTICELVDEQLLAAE
jgi:phosphoheptose isomerase